MWRTLIFLGLLGCINQAARAVNPPPEGGGTLTCREILETCDSACTQPFCLHGCSNQGTTEASEQHETLLACGERNGCVDEECMRAACPAEIETCFGGPIPPAEAESTEPTEPTEPSAPTEPTAPTEPAPPSP